MQNLIWRNATRTHDWTNLEIPAQIMEMWVSLGLVGAATWIEGKTGRKKKLSIAPPQLGAFLRQTCSAPGNEFHLRLGGTNPEWSLTGFLFPAHQGMSLFNLTVNLEALESIATRVADSFVEFYGPKLADAAFIHADPQWTLLATGPYKPPLVTTPTFAGVFWANFLGPGHAREFDAQTLEFSDVYRVRKFGDLGVSLVATPTLSEALTEPGEATLGRLTDVFRAAKR